MTPEVRGYLNEIKAKDAEIERLKANLSMHQGFEQEWIQMARERGKLISELVNWIEGDYQTQGWSSDAPGKLLIQRAKDAIKA